MFALRGTCGSKASQKLRASAASRVLASWEACLMPLDKRPVKSVRFSQNFKLQNQSMHITHQQVQIHCSCNGHGIPLPPLSDSRIDSVTDSEQTMNRGEMLGPSSHLCRTCHGHAHAISKSSKLITHRRTDAGRTHKVAESSKAARAGSLSCASHATGR